MVVIKQCTVREVEGAPNIAELLEEYAGESAIAGLPHPAAKMELYKQLESVGALYTIAAFLGDELVGFITVLSSVSAHYSVLLSTTESFFVSKKHRKTGTGLKLLYEAEQHAKERGSSGLLVSSPSGGSLAEVLPHVGYTETNRVFFKGFGDE